MKVASLLVFAFITIFASSLNGDVLQDTCDTGAQDTIIVGSVQVPGPLWPDSIGLPVYIWADEPIAAFSWGLRPLDNRIRVSSFSKIGSVFPAQMFIPTLVDTVNNRIGFGWADFMGTDPVESPQGLVGTVYFHINPNVSVAESLGLDSTSVGPAYKCRLSSVYALGQTCEMRYVEFRKAPVTFGSPDDLADVYFSFDEGSGQILYERSGGGPDGIVLGNPVWQVGVSGNALHFDGLDDNVHFEEPIASIGDQLTISSWATIPSNLASGPYIFATSAGGEWGLRIFDNKIACYVTTTCGTFYANSEIPILGWHHFAFSWHRNNALTLYVDGDSITQVQVPNCPLRSMPPLPIMGPFEGALDEFLLFHRVLTPSEILTEYLRVNYVSCGDADASRQINIADVVFLVNYIFAGGAAPPQLPSADVTCSGSIDITDVVYLVNYFFAGGAVPCAACS